MVIGAMGLNPFHVTLALSCVIGIVAILWLGRPGWLSGRNRGRLPIEPLIIDSPQSKIPLDAQQPLAYLGLKLHHMGFRPASGPVHIPALQRFTQQLLLVPFVHPEEHSLFIMGIETYFIQESQLMLHIITPLKGGKRVETTTLEALSNLIRPKEVDLRIVLDADTVEEIWSRHRLALNEYGRDERIEIDSKAWKDLVTSTYSAWLKAAVRSQRLALTSDGLNYRIRSGRGSIL